MRIALDAMGGDFAPKNNLEGLKLALNECLELQEDGSFRGSFVVREDGYYRVELMGPDDAPVPASPQYTIDVLSDQPPSLSFNTPGRDIQASPIDEVFVEARADDDFGVGRLNLMYSVNGEAEDTISLYRADGSGDLGCTGPSDSSERDGTILCDDGVD